MRAARNELPWQVLVPCVAALAAALFLAYYPAWHGGPVWDDENHLTRAALQSLDGLRRIWLDVGATAQYYPLVHTVFWVEHRLWGDATLGYHLVNICLHLVSSCLVFVVLRRLGVRGAALAAVVFALHPVHVESVAWMTELKNTLSGVFFLSSALFYLRFDRDRGRRSYAAAAVFFCLALLSKSVTATLPGVLLVVLWWQGRRLAWRRDVLPLVPFAIVGAVSGLFTAWVERTEVGARGAEFGFTFVERTLIAGRVAWFYLGKLFWPSNLVFVYPRWEVSQSNASQYLYPIGAIALLAGAWLLRGRTRAPLAALLAFVGLLFPVLGFLDVYPFRFSFVADHFQYLASIPVIALVSAALSHAVSRVIPAGGKWGDGVLATGLALVLLPLTWHQSAQYADAVTLYRTTVERNPSAWMAQGNLGAILRRTDPAQALHHLAAAVRLKPDSVEPQYNLAATLQDLGRLEEAAIAYGKTIELAPQHARAYANLAHTLALLGRQQEAEKAYGEAIRIAPDLGMAHCGLGRLLRTEGRLEEALRACQAGVTLEPGFAGAHRDLAGVLEDMGRYDDAIREYESALRIHPQEVEVLNDLATMLAELGRFDEAIEHFQQAVRLEPASGVGSAGMCGTLRMMGRLDEALRACEMAIRLQPALAPAHYEHGNVLSRLGRYREALAHYQEAARLQPDAAEVHCALSIALEQLGMRSDVKDELTVALRLAPDPVAAHLAMGNALEGVGRLEAARTEFEQARALAPGLAAVQSALARVDRQLHLSRVNTLHS